MSDEFGSEEVWNARLAALQEVFGPAADKVHHATTPFELGGDADVLVFSNHFDGVVYVTADLSPADDYELVICHRNETDWGPNVISRLGAYCRDVPIRSGETMDIDSATPAGSEIRALVFAPYGKFKYLGQEVALRLCLGITKLELSFTRQQGAKQLVERLKQNGVYPFTDLNRQSLL
jgi:hypothetical protein